MDEKLASIRDDGRQFIGSFGGKERYVKFDLNAFAEMEAQYGSMDAANESLQKGSMRDIKKVLWLGLIWDEAILDEITGEPVRYNITPYDVGSWINMTNMQFISEKLAMAINGALPPEATDSDAAARALNKPVRMAAGDEDPNA